MRHFILKSIPWLILIVASGAVRYILQYDPRYVIYNYDETEIEESYVVIGDSKSMSAFNENFQPFDSTRPFINLSAWAVKPSNHLIALEDYSIKNSTIFLTLSSRNFLYPDTIYEGNPSTYVNHIWNFNLFYKIKEKYTLNQFNDMTTLGNGGVIFANEHPFNYRYGSKDDSTAYVGFLNGESQDYYTRIKLRQFIQLTRLLAKNNRVVIIDLPERSSYDSWMTEYERELYYVLQNQLGTQVVDFGVFPDEEFYDSHHLNAFGRKHFQEVFETLFSEEKWNTVIQ